MEQGSALELERHQASQYMVHSTRAAKWCAANTESSGGNYVHIALGYLHHRSATTWCPLTSRLYVAASAASASAAAANRGEGERGWRVGAGASLVEKRGVVLGEARSGGGDTASRVFAAAELDGGGGGGGVPIVSRRRPCSCLRKWHSAAWSIVEEVATRTSRSAASAHAARRLASAEGASTGSKSTSAERRLAAAVTDDGMPTPRAEARCSEARSPAAAR